MKLRNIWLEFRIGHSTYLAFTMQIINFLLITYALFLERIGIGLTIWQFAIILAVIYVPLGVFLGRLHITKQYSVENQALLEQNKVWAKVVYIQTRMIEGTATEEETKELKTYLKRIMGDLP